MWPKKSIKIHRPRSSLPLPLLSHSLLHATYYEGEREVIFERVKRRREGENTEAAGRCTYYQHYYFHATCDVRARGAAFVEIVTRGDARAPLPALHTCRPASQLATLSLCRPDRPPVPCTRVLRPHTSRPASYPERLRRRLEHLEHRAACAAPCTPIKKIRAQRVNHGDDRVLTG
jgi:hypothetical protein